MPTFTYFPVQARGYGCLLTFEEHGFAYDAKQVTPDTWGAVKATGICPFGQVPILETEDVGVIGQSVAIMQYIGKLKNAEGKDLKEKTRHDMIVGLAEDLYADVAKNVNTVFQKDKVTAEALAKFWAESLPTRLAHAEKFLDGKDRFTEAGNTIGELYFYSVLHQVKNVTADVLAKFPNLLAFYNRIDALDSVKKVNTGGSAFGTVNPYFVA